MFQASRTDLLDSYFPSTKVCNPMVIENITTNVPNFRPPIAIDPANEGDFEDYSVDIHEWLALLLLQSPRINKYDKIDSLLSRYRAPGTSVTSIDLVKVTWQGFLSPMWAHKTFVEILLTLPGDGWFAFVVGGFSEGWFRNCRSSTMLKLPDASNEYMLWDIA
jgi:ribonuclease P/MRP protein subunit RPP40